ncbi:hypothetical protein OWV82_021646 [Melia azedarach]|uniref:Uncharacterized protein n=1 Tax=Melia azedarach TaxID=155640 RepID=A0ACC1X1M1_MELAZ|nr:hypothetical protein OWV82_021646 [Melia azedarach]
MPYVIPILLLLLTTPFLLYKKQLTMEISCHTMAVHTGRAITTLVLVAAGEISYSLITTGPNGNEDSVRTEEPYQNEEHYDTDFSYHEDNVNQPAFDYNACYESCSDYIDDIFTYTEKEPRPTYGSSLEEMGFCEGVFGYWPRLYREMRQNYQQ